MTHLNIIFDDTSLKNPTEIICGKLDAKLSDSGFTVNVRKSDSLNVNSDGTEGNISYITKASFFRMLTLFIKNLKESKVFDYTENIEVKNCGVMLDLSRNGVMKPEAMADYFAYMSMVGLNTAMLYMEDVYSLSDYKYFGYMRGRYSKDELKAIDDAADMFGIEVYPAVQMLAHMEKYLKTKEAFPIRDTGRILLIGEEKTYEFIEAIFRELKGCFRSNKIHMGMDEAWNICRGEYLRLHDNQFPKLNEMLISHLKRVIKLGLDYGYDLEMWSGTTKQHCTPDDFADFEDFKKVRIWLYHYGSEIPEEEFVKYLHSEDGIASKIGVTGATFTFRGFAPENNFTLNNAKNIMTYCKKYGVDHVCSSIWMDDGTECNHFLSLLGVVAYGEYMYNKEVSEHQIKDMFELVTGTSYDAFMDMSLFHDKDMVSAGLRENEMRFWGKKFLYQDIMMGLADANLYNNPMSEHYKMCKDKFTAYKNLNDSFALHYEFFESLFDVLALKCYIAENLRPAYKTDNKDFLKTVANELLPELKEKVENARVLHRKQWHTTYKAFGFDVIDMRYSGIIGRCDTAAYRINEYLSGNVMKLEELDEVRLTFGNLFEHTYNGIVSLGISYTGQI